MFSIFTSSMFSVFSETRKHSSPVNDLVTLLAFRSELKGEEAGLEMGGCVSQPKANDGPYPEEEPPAIKEATSAEVGASGELFSEASAGKEEATTTERAAAADDEKVKGLETALIDSCVKGNAEEKAKGDELIESAHPLSSGGIEI